MRVLGGAGTGKTVVAMHRARYLAQLLQREDRSGGRVYFTTFTKILSRDIEENLKRLCTPEVFQRIHVVNIDKLVLDTLRRFDFRKDLVWHDQQAELWSKALDENVTDLTGQFFKEEWRLVIQPQQIQDLESYKTANRTGRGTRIDRKLLADIWSVFERYRRLLRDANLIEMPDAMLEAAKLLELRGNDSSYRYAVIDEARRTPRSRAWYSWTATLRKPVMAIIAGAVGSSIRPAPRRSLKASELVWGIPSRSWATM